MTPTTLGRYEIRKELGRGGMATVYLAFDPQFNREVAVKLLPHHFLHNPDFHKRFKKEARTIAALEHQSIVPVYDFGEENDQPYLVMRYMTGGTLGDRIKKGPLSFARAKTIALDIANALAVAHTRGVIHRDLKPDNILFDEFDAPYLSDFGIARLIAQTQTITKGIIGTPQYMSPEQWVSSKNLDGRCDQYALGILLFQMLTRELPFTASDTTGFMHAHINAPVPDITDKLPTSPPGINSLIQKSMAKDRDYRFPDMGAWRDSLHKIGSPGPLTPSGRNNSSTGKHGHSRAALWVWPAVAILALLFLWPGFGLEEEPAPLPPPTATAFQVAEPANTAEPTPSTAPTDLPKSTATPLPPSPTTMISPTDIPSPTRRSLGPEITQFGLSVLGRPLEVVRFGNGDQQVVFVGGIHAGFTSASVTLAETAIEYFSQNPDAIPDDVTVFIVPSLNPDSRSNPDPTNPRLNANGVDLNRNWPCRWDANPVIEGQPIQNGGGSAALSEPESMALADFFAREKPNAVIFWTARAQDGLISPGDCDNSGNTPSYDLAQIYGSAASFQVSNFEQRQGSEITGDVSNWLDREGIPAAIVLLPNANSSISWEQNLAGIMAVIQSVK